MITAVDSGRIGALMLLDLSAAFDTIDHSVLLDVLYRLFGITGIALAWFDAFLSDRHQTVYFGGTASDDTTLLFGVPQGSVLGPKVFSQYAEVLRYSTLSADTTFVIISSRTICKVIAAVYRRSSLLSSQAVRRTFVTGAKPNACS